MRALFSATLCPIAATVSDGDIRAYLAKLGLAPDDLPSETNEDAYRDYFSKKADPIVRRMPGDTADHREKKERIVACIKYCSVLPITGTQFMVTREVSGVLSFRLINEKIECLQEGCEELIERLALVPARTPWQGIDRWCKERKQRFTLKLAGRVEIYEHGLEASTIRGTLVKSRLGYGLSHSKKDSILAAGAIVLLLVALVVVQSGIAAAGSPLSGHLDRFSTAMVTTTVVSLYSILHVIITATPPVQWTAHYDRE